MTALAPTLESFFTDYLISQLGASRHTIAAYRDTWRLLLGYVFQHTGIRPSDLDLAVLDARLVGEFLTCLETERHNSPRTRNARLGAIHSFFRHAALRHPEHAAQIARVLAIPTKRTVRTVISWLTDAELGALLASPNQATWTGRRDHLLLHVMVSTGMRVGEITALTRADTCLDRPGAHIACHGKGRKDRATPIDADTGAVLSAWFAENPGSAVSPLFYALGTNRPMTTDAIAQRVALHTASAAQTCPSITAKNVTPHVLRHYVDGWVMWPAGVFLLAGAPSGAGSGHITRGPIGRRGRAIRGDPGRPSSWVAARG